jgi:sugar/nucleoside kinase (ribokinase family)
MAAKRRTIGIVGTFIRDTIVPLSGEPVESIGGLYHTSAYLAQLSLGKQEVRVVCNLGDDFYDVVCDALGRFSNFRLHAVKRIPMINTQVRLIYRSPETRDEITSAPVPPITETEIGPLLDCDAVLINLITGRDIELSALQALRERSRKNGTLIYLDLHSLVLGIDAKGKRYYRNVSAWRQWLGAVDIVQMNEREAATVAGFDDTFDLKDLEALGRQIVDAGQGGMSICNITLGSNGSLLIYRDGGNIRRVHCPPQPISNVVDIIGCGDAFGAAFITSYVENRDPAAAARFANRVAGLNCTFMGSLTAQRFEQYLRPYLSNEAS